MRIRVIYWLAVALVLGGGAALRWVDPNPVARLRLVAFDTLQQWQPRTVDPTYPIRIVDIDDRSLAAIGAWPWRREILARLVEQLLSLGATVVAFDLVLPHAELDLLATLPDAIKSNTDMQSLLRALEALPSGDQRLAETISDKPVVLGMIGRHGASEPTIVSRSGFALLGIDPARHVPFLPAVTGNTAALQRAAPGLGALNWFPEHDQIVRKVPMLVRLGGNLAPSLVAETIRVGAKTTTIAVRSSTASAETPFVAETGITSVRIGKHLVPTDRAGQMWLSFTARDPERFRSAVDVLEGRVPRNDIAGRIVLIGASAPGLFDIRATPLDTVVAGVEVHAQAIEQVLAGNMLHRPDLSTGLEVVFSTLSGLLLALLVYRAGPLSGAILGVATLTAVLAAAWWARARFGYLLDPAYPVLSLTVIYTFSTGFFYFHTERERNEVRWQFSHYLDPVIVEALARRPDKLRLGGESRTVTLYRSDLAGFSRLSEELPPHELVLLLNEYLTAMTDIVRDHKGYIDKYIGDAIDGVFGEPADDPEHALHAVKAALASRARLQEMNAAGLPVLRGRKLNQRIGLHTGMGIVGNIGSSSRRRQKFKILELLGSSRGPGRRHYTVIGDSANLASRLEGANKFYGTTILASEATVELAGPVIVWREIDTVRVVGRTGPVRIYEPMGPAGEVSEECMSLMKLYAEGLSCWRAQDFAGACRSFERISKTDAPARFFLKRCQQLMQEPPAPGWDHVHALDSK